MGDLLRIFISYRRSETRGYVGWLSYCLEDEFGRENVFRDVETIGIAQWRTSIDDAIRLSDVVLCVMGDQWLTVEKSGARRLDDPNDMVRFEVGMALRCMAKHDRVVPTRGDCTLFDESLRSSKTESRVAKHDNPPIALGGIVDELRAVFVARY